MTRPDNDPDRHLQRVRALLAKAESTTYTDEAAALSAKAHELIAEHAIDLAMLEEQHGRGDVVTITIFIDAPYVKEKFLLLGGVARASRCCAILGIEQDLLMEMVDSGELFENPDGRHATVVGYRSDLEAVELLFTSLLVQAVNTMLAHGSSIGPWGENRTRSFRRSFLASFAWTIRQRFEETERRSADAANTAAAGTVLPVLVDRESEVLRIVEDRFPDATPLRTSISNYDGVQTGRAAGMRADIGTTRLERTRAALRP